MYLFLSFLFMCRISIPFKGMKREKGLTTWDKLKNWEVRENERWDKEKEGVNSNKDINIQENIAMTPTIL